MADSSAAPLYPWRIIDAIQRGLATRARNTRRVSSLSVRLTTRDGSDESPRYAAGSSPRSARTVATIPPWYW